MTDEELQAYYEAHKEAYREPEQRQIRYVTIPLERFTQHYSPSAEEVSDYYTDVILKPSSVRSKCGLAIFSSKLRHQPLRSRRRKSVRAPKRC